MKHLDLFSGIGGFALAVDEAFENAEHIFCEIDPFCQQVLKKHFSNSLVHADIKTLKADNLGRIDLLTGGFPCQPFSQAGLQRGQEDDRYLWPEMLRIIKESKPTWIVGENVAGIINMALEQVCLDLEAEGYEVQPIVIPAVAVNAPHRRDRVWIIANRKSEHQERCESEGDRAGQPEEAARNGNCNASDSNDGRQEEQKQQAAGDKQCDRNATNPSSERLEGRQQDEAERHDRLGSRERSEEGHDWETNWIEVATEFCSVDDGLPATLDEFKCTKAQHRAHQLKAYGNAIVPQVAAQIIKLLPITHD